MHLQERKLVRTREFSRDPRRISALATTVAMLFATFLLAFVAGFQPVLAVGMAAALFFGALLASNPSWIVHGLLLALFVAMPPGDKGGIRIAGFFIYYYEPFLFGSFIYVIMLLRGSPEVAAGIRKSPISWAAMAFSVTVVVGIASGRLHGYPLKDVQEDVRPVVNMMIAVLVCAVIVAMSDYRRYVKTISAILLFSAAYTLYGSVTGKSIGGRMETAQLVGVGGDVLAGGSTALRFLTDATPLAMAVLLVSTTLILLGLLTAKQIAVMLIPAVVISFLGFSRNTILALAGCVLFAILIAVVDGRFVPLIRRLFIAVVVTTVAATGFTCLDTPSEAAIGSTCSSRVIRIASWRALPSRASRRITRPSSACMRTNTSRRRVLSIQYSAVATDIDTNLRREIPAVGKQIRRSFMRITLTAGYM